MSVFVTLSSTTLIELAVTLEMMGGCCTGGGDAFFLEPAKAGVETIPSRAAITKRMELDLFTTLLLIEWNIRQNRRLDHVLRFFHFFGRVHGLTAGVHQSRGHEEGEVASKASISSLNAE